MGVGLGFVQKSDLSKNCNCLDDMTSPDPNHPGLDLLANQWIGTLGTARKDVNSASAQWTLAVWPTTGVTITQDSIVDIFLVCRYSIS